MGASADEAVLRAEKSWGAAVASGNLTALAAIAGDDLTYSHSTGAQDTKMSYIAKLKSGELKYTAFDYDPGLAVRVYGGVGLVTGSAKVTSFSNGKDSSTHLHFLHVFVNRNGAWQLVAHQSARLPN